jgi:hypothetical protein
MQASLCEPRENPRNLASILTVLFVVLLVSLAMVSLLNWTTQPAAAVGPPITAATSSTPYEFTVLSSTQTMIGGYPYLIVKVQSDSSQTLTDWLWAYVYVSGIFFAPAAEFTAKPGATVTVDLDMTTDVGGGYSGYLYVMTPTQVHLSAGLAVSGTLPWLPTSTTTTTTTTITTTTSSPTTTSSTTQTRTTTTSTESRTSTTSETSSTTSRTSTTTTKETSTTTTTSTTSSTSMTSQPWTSTTVVESSTTVVESSTSSGGTTTTTPQPPTTTTTTVAPYIKPPPSGYTSYGDPNGASSKSTSATTLFLTPNQAPGSNSSVGPNSAQDSDSSFMALSLTWSNAPVFLALVTLPALVVVLRRVHRSPE